MLHHLNAQVALAEHAQRVHDAERLANLLPHVPAARAGSSLLRSGLPVALARSSQWVRLIWRSWRERPDDASVAPELDRRPR